MNILVELCAVIFFITFKKGANTIRFKSVSILRRRMKSVGKRWYNCLKQSSNFVKTKTENISKKPRQKKIIIIEKTKTTKKKMENHYYTVYRQLNEEGKSKSKIFVQKVKIFYVYFFTLKEMGSRLQKLELKDIVNLSAFFSLIFIQQEVALSSYSCDNCNRIQLLTIKPQIALVETKFATT